MRRWLRYATEDLDSARRLLADPDFPPRLSCFLAQQAAEKAIKAVLIEAQIRFPFIHDLEALRELVPPGWSLATLTLSLTPLSAWVVQGRYPADLPEANDADALFAVNLASAVVDAVLTDLPNRGIGDREAD